MLIGMMFISFGCVVILLFRIIIGCFLIIFLCMYFVGNLYMKILFGLGWLVSFMMFSFLDMLLFYLNNWVVLWKVLWISGVVFKLGGFEIMWMMMWLLVCVLFFMSGWIV